MKTKKLPKKASDLILLALEDLRKVEKSKNYEVDMSKWHRPNGKCSVCFAGSVMAYSLNANIEHTYEPDEFERHADNRLCALDEFRKGNINDGLDMMTFGDEEYSFKNINIKSYEKDKGRFKRQMKSMAIMLQKNNL